MVVGATRLQYGGRWAHLKRTGVALWVASRAQGGTELHHRLRHPPPNPRTPITNMLIRNESEHPPSIPPQSVDKALNCDWGSYTRMRKSRYQGTPPFASAGIPPF
eukprot:1192275-Prorocentrum_minimum.AAC.2